jgi:DNA polymerase (family X)
VWEQWIARPLSTGPFLLRRLHQVGAADPKRIDTLTQDGILTPADFELALAEGRPSVDGPSLRPFAETIVDQQEPPGLGRAHDLLDPVLAQLSQQDCGLESLIASGDVRRYLAQPRHLVVVGLSADPSRVIAAAASLPAFTDVVHRSRRRLIAIVQEHEIDLRVAPREEFGSLLFMTTGPADHVAAVLRRRGPRLCATEEGVYAHAGIHYVPPELRDSPGVVDEALGGPVPRLVTRADIRGDLHMHSTYSDGRDALREMVAECHTLRYEYIAITDHSEHASAFHTLTLESLHRQREEIASLREQYPGMTILHGIEADILSDGSIDCPDAVMASLDIVLASLHEHGGHNRRKLTARCLKAIRHPLVSVITHPQNQIVGHRPPYDMDYDAIYEAAAETGTALEIDGAPAHLDLDGAKARAAIGHGVTVTIDSDCHRARWLDRQMDFGLGTARRGAVEPRHVLNTRPLGEVRQFLQRKRSGARS